MRRPELLPCACNSEDNKKIMNTEMSNTPNRFLALLTMAIVKMFLKRRAFLVRFLREGIEHVRWRSASNFFYKIKNIMHKSALQVN